jgi:ubiquinol-cytochrome c reductase cytochrome c1 subunit
MTATRRNISHHKLNALAIAACLVLAPGLATAAGGEQFIEHADIDIGNEASLQRGAKYFVNYCLGCHSAKYVRYNRLGEDLGLTEAQVIDNLMFTGERPHDTMDNAMPDADAATWFGQAPPDLSLTARSRGTDWIYSFLKSFYLDPDKPTGVNNLVLQGASMPHVLWRQQGLQQAVFVEEFDEAGNPHEMFEGFELETPGLLSPEEYDQMIRDITAFLSYVAEPVQLDRRSLGIKVILFLVVLLLFAILLKKEIWKEVH